MAESLKLINLQHTEWNDRQPGWRAGTFKSVPGNA